MNPFRNFLLVVAGTCWLLWSSLSVAEVPASPEPLLQPFVDQYELAGAIWLVACKDGELSITSVGFADIEANRPMSQDAMFWIASQSKPMTAARILEVVSEMSYEDFMRERLFDPLGMTDTTFWPSEEQIRRLAKSYRPDKDKTNLEEFSFGQMKAPLNDRSGRFPMPAGGLFSTARDTAQFCRMMLNGGALDGKRYISEASFKELTTKQTPEEIQNAYGLGYAIGGESFGHGGAHATKMDVFPKHGIAVIWMVQHGGFPGDGKNAHGVFKNWALERFGEK